MDNFLVNHFAWSVANKIRHASSEFVSDSSEWDAVPVTHEMKNFIYQQV